MYEVAKCFPPVYDGLSEMLFLGTIPSVGSVKNGFYYLGQGNAFWSLLSEVFRYDFVSLADECKAHGGNDGASISALVKAVKDHRIALYDTINESVRHGSRDDQIDSAVLQSEEALLTILRDSRIRIIFCTSTQALNNLFGIFGGKRRAESVLREVMNLGEDKSPFEKLISPSATALMYGQMTREARLKDWLKIRKYIE